MGRILGPQGGGGGGGSSSGGSPFAPSKRNLYEAVKAIFHPGTNPGVTADDTDAELDVAAGGGALPAKATNADVDAETDDVKYVTVLKVFRAIARKVKNASATVRGIVILARNADVDATETDPTRVPDVTRAKRLILRFASEEWSTIPANRPIGVGKVVEHGDAFFGCHTAHNKAATGPDGDAAHWTLLSNFYGAWGDNWYPAGAFVTHAGLPYVATAAVVRGNPQPNAAANTKWLALGAELAGVVSYAANTVVTAANRGFTYRQTGATARRLSLPDASGGSEVPNGWDLVVANGSTADLAVAPNGADTIGGNAALTVGPGRAVRLQKVATGVWIIVADTKDESGGADLPTVVNVAANTAIPDTAFGDTYRVTGNVARTITLPDPADVALGWFVRIANGSPAGVSHSVAREGAGQSIEGGNGPLTVRPGESVTIQKVNTNEWELIADTSQGAAATGGALSLSTALTDAQKKAWRAHFGSWHLDVTDNSTLPAIANYNGPDGILLGQSGDTTVQFADISDRSTMLTAGEAGDLMLLLGRGWVRVGNLFTGGAAVAAVKAIADANKVAVDRLHVFGTVVVNPAGIPDNNFPEFLGLALANKIDPRRIVSIRVKIGGQQAAAAVTTEALVPFNDLGSGELTQRGRGGILNLVLGATTRANLKNAAPSSVQYLQGEIEYKFEGTSLQPDVLPDVVDHFSFAVNNNGYPAIVGLTQSQVDARVQALNRTLTAKAATAGATEVWTYPLDAADTEIWIGAVHANGLYGKGTFPRAVLSGAARQIPIDHRNPGGQGGGSPQSRDNMSIGVDASIAGNTLTLTTVGWEEITGAPLVYSK